MVEASEIPFGHIFCTRCEGRCDDACDECDGEGHVTRECDRGYEHDEDCGCDNGRVECWECGGTGYIPDPDMNTDEGL